MQAVSPYFLTALDGSHGHVVRVDAWRGGKLLSPDGGLPVAGGTITITEGQAIRTALSVTIADPDGQWTPQADGALSPYGSELHVQLGIRAGALAELVSIGWCPITVASTDERWQAYPTMVISRGQSTDVSATDRAQIIAAARFMSRTQPVNTSVFAEIASLLQGVVPWQAPTGLADGTVPAGITYTDDRLGAVNTLAAVLDQAVVFNPAGTATLAPRHDLDAEGNDNTSNPAPLGAAVWTIPVHGGSVVTFARELNADATYNGVIVRGTAFNGSALVGQSVITTGPLAWDGPFGQVPYFVTSATLGTQAGVDAAAVAELARLVAQRSQIIVISCVSNPALEVGDVVTVPAPKGRLNGRVVSIQWPLTPGPMSVSVSVSSTDMAAVS